MQSSRDFDNYSFKDETFDKERIDGEERMRAFEFRDRVSDSVSRSRVTSLYICTTPYEDDSVK